MASKISLVLCLLMAAIATGQVEVQPREAVIVRGGNVSMVCKVAYRIDSCRIRVAGVTHNLRPDRVDHTSNVQYHGNGFQSGECGVAINRVDDSMNGNITCSLPQESTSAEIEGIMRLVIARAPDQPQLTLSAGSISTNVFLAGDKLQARCEVPHGRPPAKITWYLENEQLLDGLHQVVIQDEPNSDLQTISQNLTKTITPEDDGASLVCRAEHEALSSPYRAERQLDVQYPPQSLESSTLTIFGVRLREDDLLNVTVRANPPPQVTWTIGSVRLRAGEVDHEGKFEARHLQPLGSSFYMVSLLIRGVEKADVDRQYALAVENNHGEQYLTIRISTNDVPPEPPSAGSIVGIVLAVLVIIIAVSLTVYAKTTHRWCFADAVDGGENRARSSGESSDTESAVAGPKTERRRLPDLSRALPALRSVLPSRGRKDKVVAETLPDPKPTDEEEKPLQEGDKKSVVYAELALATPAAPLPPKPTPESTEYAEIGFGTQQTNEPPANNQRA